MKKLAVAALALLAWGMLAGAALPGGTLAAVQQKDVLVVGVQDSLPPFGFVDEKTRRLTGYDIDFVQAIAQRCGWGYS